MAIKLKWPLVGFALAFLLLPAVVISTATALEGHDPFCSACHTEPIEAPGSPGAVQLHSRLRLLGSVQFSVNHRKCAYLPFGVV